MSKVSELIGKVIQSIKGKVGEDEIVIVTDNGERYRMFHDQECCESVTVEDICGNLDDLVGSPITQAEESASDNNPEGVSLEYQDSFTWTFYRLATSKGQVVIRWYGESNGYYSESVELEKVQEETAPAE